MVPPSTTTAVSDSARCKPGQRLVAVAAPREDLGDHGVELGRDPVALRHARVDADAGPGRQPQQADAARGGRESATRILCVEAGLDRVPDHLGRLAVEAAADGHVKLELDEVDARRHLGHGMLDLQPCVDLHEGEPLIGRLVEELHRGGAAVAGPGDQAGRGLADLAVLVGGDDGAGRLLQHLLVAALEGAVAQADGPRRPVRVGDHLHLDVARRGDEPLQQDAVVAEGLQRLRAGALECRREGLEGVHATDTAPPATRGRLDHERDADPAGVGQGVADGLDGPAAPHRHGDADALREPLGVDLVADAAHHVGVRAREDDPEPFAQLRELGLLGDEAPAHPRGVRPHADEGALERLVVEVAALALAVRRIDEDRRPDAPRPRPPPARTARCARARCRGRSP